jgi:hypothetical protein
MNMKQPKQWTSNESKNFFFSLFGTELDTCPKLNISGKEFKVSGLDEKGLQDGKNPLNYVIRTRGANDVKQGEYARRIHLIDRTIQVYWFESLLLGCVCLLCNVVCLC